MLSISELSLRWGIPYKRLNRWIKECRIGNKVGWAIILTEAEAEELLSWIKTRRAVRMGKPGRPVELNQGSITNGSQKAA